MEQYLAETDWATWETIPDDFEDTADEETIRLARRMKADGMAEELIAKYACLTAEEVAKL